VRGQKIEFFEFFFSMSVSYVLWLFSSENYEFERNFVFLKVFRGQKIILRGQKIEFWIFFRVS
jgi:hypothetical protein